MDQPCNRGSGRKGMHNRRIRYRRFFHVWFTALAACPAFISLPVMINYLEFCRNKLYLCTDEFFSDPYHSASAFFTDLLTFINGMQYFAVWNVFDQFFPLACIFLFTEMCFHFRQTRFRRIRVCTGLCFIKKRHLPFNLKNRCLLGFCSIKFTGQEIHLLLQEQDLLFQFFDMILILLSGILHSVKILPLQ